MSFIIYPHDSIFCNILGFEIRYYGLIMASVFFLGLFFASFLFKKYISKNESELFLDYSPWIILISIVGARIFYVIGEFDFYISHPAEILMINHGGLSIFGAIFFGLISLYLFSKKKKFSFFAHCDIFALVFPLCQAIGRFGNYFNQEAYGAPFNGFIKMYIDKYHRFEKFSNVDYYHPTFLYESLLDFLAFFLLLIIFLKFKTRKTGLLTGLYLILYSVIRFAVESIRIDSVLNIASIPIAQIISLITLFLGFVILFFIYKKRAS